MKNRYRFCAVLILLLSGISSAFTVLVRPQQAEMRPGETIRFEAQLFNSDQEPVRAQLVWSLMPENLGRITQDGFFIAGLAPTEGEVRATATIDGEEIVGTALVKIGEGNQHEIEIQVHPEKVSVPFGETVQFEAKAISRNGVLLTPQSLRWFVEPGVLGQINENGLFTAGSMMAIGRTIAVAEIDGRTYRGSAMVAINPTASASLKGSVTDAAGSALAGATVTAMLVSRFPFVVHAVTGADGSFAIDSLIPGSYVVQAFLTGYAPQYYNHVNTFQEATPIELASAEERQGVDFALQQSGVISGRVTDQEGLPLAGAHISAYNRGNILFRTHAISNSNGHYELTGLLNGRYIVIAELSGYLNEYYPEAEKLSDAQAVEIIDYAQVDGIDFTLSRTSAIVGRVTSKSNQQPIAGARVLAYGLSNGRGLFDFQRPFAQQAETDEDGQYVLSVQPGIYIVHAIAAGFEMMWFDNTTNPMLAKPLQPDAGEHLTADFALTSLGSITGIVRDAATQTGIAGARVSVFAENASRAVFNTFTGEDGSFRFESLPEGSYLMRAGATGYLAQYYDHAADLTSATAVHVETDQEITAIDFDLQTGSSMSGKVIAAENNEPVASAIINVYQLDGPVIRATRSNPSGMWQLNGLPAGVFIAVAQARGTDQQFYDGANDRTNATPIELDGVSAINDIDFVLRSRIKIGGQISGVVVDEQNNTPVEGAMVIAIPAQFGRAHHSLSTADGSYQLAGLRDGTYYVICRARGYIGEYYDNAYHWRDAQTIQIQAGQSRDGVNFSLAPQQQGAYWIAGNVKDQNGAPIEGVLLTLGTEEQVTAATSSREDGAFLFEEMPFGSYTLSISYPSAADESSDRPTMIAVGNSTAVSDLRITLVQSTTEIEDAKSLPIAFALEQNYPNPFNPSTEIRFSLPIAAKVELTVFNLLGQPIRVLSDLEFKAGSHAVVWDGRDQQGLAVPSGVYFYQLQAGSPTETFQQTRRMVLMK